MSDNGGIYSLSGFAYQIKVFILHMLELRNGYTLEYETIDDVALKIQAENIDEHEDELYSLLTTMSRKAIQVKKTKVTSGSAKRIIENWVLADKDVNNIEEFVLVTNRKTDSNIFANLDVDEILKEVKESEGDKSISAKVKMIGYTEEELKKKIQNIISKASVQEYEDIDTTIKDEFADYFIRAGVTESTYVLRIKQLIQQITVEILNAVSKGNAYQLTYEEMCHIKNSIIVDITDEKWEPRFSEFRKLKKLNVNDLALIKSREYSQLKHCVNLKEVDIARHLQYGEYYENAKRTYCERGMKSIVEDMENTAFDNFCDAKMELRSKNSDTPDNRLIETKAKSNSRATDEQIRYGVCINLTSDSTDENIQISWKDD